MPTTSVFNLVAGTSLASGDVLPFVDISDTTQSAHGSLLKITVANFFATVPSPVNITSNGANALAVGRQGTTNPGLAVDASTASCVTGIKVTSKAAAAGVDIAVTSSGTNEPLNIDGKGSGNVTLNATGTGYILVKRYMGLGTVTTPAYIIQAIESNAGSSAIQLQNIGESGDLCRGFFSVHCRELGGDPQIGFGIDDTNGASISHSWHMGIDNSDDDNFKLAQGTIGVSDKFAVYRATGSGNTAGEFSVLAGPLSVKGAFGTHGASKAGVDFNSGIARIWSWGADASTLGQVSVQLRSSDGSVALTPITVSSAAVGFGTKFGYNAGVGGTVTQGAGSGKATGFTLDKATGQITTDNANLNADTTVSATWTNSVIAATDTVVINHVSGGTVGSYTFNVQCGAGTATLNIRNITPGNLAEALVLQFNVIKGVNN